MRFPCGEGTRGGWPAEDPPRRDRSRLQDALRLGSGRLQDRPDHAGHSRAGGSVSVPGPHLRRALVKPGSGPGPNRSSRRPRRRDSVGGRNLTCRLLFFAGVGTAAALGSGPAIGLWGPLCGYFPKSDRSRLTHRLSISGSGFECKGLSRPCSTCGCGDWI